MNCLMHNVLQCQESRKPSTPVSKNISLSNIEIKKPIKFFLVLHVASCNNRRNLVVASSQLNLNRPKKTN